MSEDTRSVETHFEFGKNWASYAELINEDKIASAKEGMLKLVGADDIAGARFLDIGSGSGLHSCVAGLLGAGSILAVDIDKHSVETTRAVLSGHLPDKQWDVRELSVFDMDPKDLGNFDVVYSWGVLHHTGDLKTAIGKAAALVKPGGLLVLALYRPTYMDWFWKVEKRWYTSASPMAQKRVQWVYDACLRSALFLTGNRHKSDRHRGMDYWHDVHDWLGGYPYESMGPRELAGLLISKGFVLEREFARRKGSGIFGSGCDEFVYRLGPMIK